MATDPPLLCGWLGALPVLLWVILVALQGSLVLFCDSREESWGGGEHSLPAQPHPQVTLFFSEFAWKLGNISFSETFFVTFLWTLIWILS